MDITSATIDLSIIYPELALLVASFVIFVMPFFRGPTRFAPFIAFAGLLAAAIFAAGQWGSQQSGFFGMVSCDNFGVAFKHIFILTSAIALFMGYRYLVVKGINRPEYYGLLLIATVGMMVMANSTDLVVIFLGLEVMSVPLYIMAGMARRSLESNEAGIKYFIMGAFASAFLLMGIAFVFGAAGTTDLRRIVADFNFIMSNAQPFMLTGVGLLVVGFGFKIAAVPFHSWVPDVYQGAPTPVTAFFSVGPKAAGFAALLRVFAFGFADVTIMVTVFQMLAILTMTVGNIFALRQNNVKRLLAYSSIAHAGYVLVAVVAGGSEGLAAAVFYLVAYALFNLGGFAVVVLMETRSGCKSDFSELAGLARVHPYLSAILALFMFALAGFPPTVGFFGKFYIFAAAVKAGYIPLAVVGVMNSFLSVYYYLRVVKTSYFDETDKEFAPVKYTPAVVLVLTVTVIGTLGLGLFPQQLVEFSRAALFAFL
ncbi:MAG: NADH-quinone oxidoreductase subunit N [Candidatus Zixiibacteriota bacterium]|nr:MAG: NADH-quinone oxidoreductase subunit N [candidate division Zixibacteria bacterium]